MQGSNPDALDTPLAEESRKHLSRALKQMYMGDSVWEPDVTLDLGVARIPAHRVILAAGSPVLKAMFQVCPTDDPRVTAMFFPGFSAASCCSMQLLWTSVNRQRQQIGILQRLIWGLTAPKHARHMDTSGLGLQQLLRCPHHILRSTLAAALTPVHGFKYDMHDAQSAMADSTSASVEIKEVDAGDMEIILKYLNGKLGKIPEDRLSSLLLATDRFEV